jgi:hypothetical protein
MVNVHQGHAKMPWGIFTCLGPCYHVLSCIVNHLVSPWRLLACPQRHLSYLGYMLIGLERPADMSLDPFSTSWSWWPCLEILLHCLVDLLVCSRRPLSCCWRHLPCRGSMFTCQEVLLTYLGSLLTCLGNLSICIERACSHVWDSVTMPWESQIVYIEPLCIYI